MKQDDKESNKTNPKEGDSQPLNSDSQAQRKVTPSQSQEEKNNRDDKRIPAVKARLRDWWGQIKFVDPLILVFTGVIAVSTSIYTCFAARQWKTMEQQLELSQRPWVSANVDIAGPLFFENNSPGIRLKIRLKNTGNSPATSIVPLPIMFVRETQPMNVLQVQKRRCVRQPPSPSGGFGYTLFPSGDVEEYNTPSMARDEIEGAGRFISPFIIVCINYKFTFSGEPHQTATMYSLVRLDPAHPGQAFAINPHGGPIPAESLWLIPMGSYAD